MGSSSEWLEPVQRAERQAKSDVTQPVGSDRQRTANHRKSESAMVRHSIGMPVVDVESRTQPNSQQKVHLSLPNWHAVDRPQDPPAVDRFAFQSGLPLRALHQFPPRFQCNPPPPLALCSNNGRRTSTMIFSRWAVQVNQNFQKKGLPQNNLSSFNANSLHQLHSTRKINLAKCQKHPWMMSMLVGRGQWDDVQRCMAMAQHPQKEASPHRNSTTAEQQHTLRETTMHHGTASNPCIQTVSWTV